MRVIALRCTVCLSPYLHIYNGVCSVESRHNGSIHSNSISLRLLIQLAEISHHCHTEADLLATQEQAGLHPCMPIQRDDGLWVLPLRCHLRGCNAPWAHLARGNIEIVSWHGRDKHVNAVTYEALRVLTGE